MEALSPKSGRVNHRNRWLMSTAPDSTALQPFLYPQLWLHGEFSMVGTMETKHGSDYRQISCLPGTSWRSTDTARQSLSGATLEDGSRARTSLHDSVKPGQFICLLGWEHAPSTRRKDKREWWRKRPHEQPFSLGCKPAFTLLIWVSTQENRLEWITSLASLSFSGAARGHVGRGLLDWGREGNFPLVSLCVCFKLAIYLGWIEHLFCFFNFFLSVFQGYFFFLDLSFCALVIGLCPASANGDYLHPLQPALWFQFILSTLS